MRSLKTGLAVLICLALYTVLPLNQPTLAVLVAVMAIQNTIVDSVTFSKNRLIGTILGTIIGIIYIQVAGDSLIFVAVGVIILITLLNKLKQSQNIVVALVLFINIITGVVTGNPIIYGLGRFANTLVGITVGFLINYLIKPPNQISKMKENVIETVDEIDHVVKDLIFTDLTINLKNFKKEIESIESNLEIYNKDTKYRMALMDKIKYVEQSVSNYSVLYSHILIIKDQRAPLDESNRAWAQDLFGKDYVPQKNIIADEAYVAIYNYHISEILKKLTNIKSDLENVTRGKAVKQGFLK